MFHDCPSCGYAYDWVGKHWGDEVACPKCGKRFALAELDSPRGRFGRRLLTGPGKVLVVAGPSGLIVLAGVVLFFVLRPAQPIRSARRLMRERAYDEVIALLEGDSVQTPRDWETTFLLARAYLAKKEFSRARGLFEEAAELDPRTRKRAVPVYLKMLSSGLVDDGYADVAYAREAVALAPESVGTVASTCFRLAQEAEECENYPTAVSLAQTAGEMVPGMQREAGALLANSACALARADWKNAELPRLAGLVGKWSPGSRNEMARTLLDLSDAALDECGAAQQAWFRMLAGLSFPMRTELGVRLIARAQAHAEADDLAKAVATADLAVEMSPIQGAVAAQIHLRAAKALLDTDQIGPKAHEHLVRVKKLAPLLGQDAAPICLRHAEARGERGDWKTQELLLNWAIELHPSLKSEAADILKDVVVALTKADWTDSEIERLAHVAAAWHVGVRGPLAKELLAVSTPAVAAGDSRAKAWFDMLVKLSPAIRGDVGSFLIKGARAQVEAGRIDQATWAADLAVAMTPGQKANAAEVYVAAAEALLGSDRIDSKTHECLRRAKGHSPLLGPRLARACLAKARRLDGVKHEQARRMLVGWASELEPRAREEVAQVCEELLDSSLTAARYGEALWYAREAVATSKARTGAVGKILEAKGVELVGDRQASAGLGLLRTARQLGHKLSADASRLLRTVIDPVSKFRVDAIVKDVRVGSVGLSHSRRGEASIAFQDAGSGSLRYAYWMAGEWRFEEIDAGKGPKLGAGCCLVVGSDDRPRVAYCGDEPSDLCCLKYAERIGPGNWTVIAVPTAPKPDAREDHGRTVSLRVDRQGQPHIAHWCATAGLMYTQRRGRKWRTGRVSDAGGPPCLALDSRDLAHIVAVGATRTLRRFFRDGDRWRSRIVNKGAREGCVAFGPSGRPQFVMKSADLLYLAPKGTYGEKAEIARDGDISSTGSLAIDTVGGPHVVYVTRDDASYCVVYARKGAKGKWEQHTVFSSASEISRDSLSLCLVDNRPYITLSDGSGLSYAQPR